MFDVNSSQEEVYDFTVRPAIAKVLEGYNSTILAYGQTGAGKTFTMEGKMPKVTGNVGFVFGGEVWDVIRQIIRLFIY